jgi:hypothetical protein
VARPKTSSYATDAANPGGSGAGAARPGYAATRRERTPARLGPTRSGSGRERGRIDGAFGHLRKPIDLARLIAVVEQAAKSHRLALARREASHEIEGRSIGDRAGLADRKPS